MSWVAVAIGGSALVGAGASAYSSNAAKQSNQDMLNAQANNKIDPVTIGTNSLNAQAGLAPTALQLNNQYGGQFANSNNNSLVQGLWGQSSLPGTTDLATLAKDANFAQLPANVQEYLGKQATQGGLGGLGHQFGGSPYENMVGLYRGMTGKSVGTPEENDAFNGWTVDSGFQGWGQGEGLSTTLGKWGTTAANTPAPGVTDIIGKLDQQLNPGYADAMTKLGTAAGVAPGTITAPTVANSANAGTLQGMIGNSATPQVSAGNQANAGITGLQGLLGQSGYQSVTGSSVAAPGGPNLAGPAATSAAPSLGAAQQSNGASAGPAAQSAGASNVQGPSSFERLSGTSVTGPGAAQQVTAPGSVASVQGPGSAQQVQANTSFDRVNAPNANLQQVQLGQNQALSGLQSQGFNANRPIQQTLEQQAQGDLALGGQLSADQIRMAQQASRSASGSRGMVNSNGAILDEVQRQMDRSGQLLNERRGFAANVENQGFGQLNAQQQNAISTAGLQNNYLGMGVEAQQANNQNQLAQSQMGLQANLANQGAGLAANQLGLQGQIANQNAGTQYAQMGQNAQMANQNAALSTNQMGLQAGMANQNAATNYAQMGQQAQLANQQNAYQVGAANQAAGQNMQQMGLTAGLANQQAGQQNSQFNAGQANAMGQFNAGQGQQNQQFNAGQANQQMQLLAQLGLQNNQFNAGQSNAMDQFNAGQADTAAARALQASQTNAQLQQQANLSNQAAFQQNYGQQLGAAGALGGLQNDQASQALQAQMSNQNAYLQNQGQNYNALQALIGSDNSNAQFNAQTNMGAQQFNANQQQQGFGNALAYQQAQAQGRMDPLAAMNFANGQQNMGMFDPFNPAITSIYAANSQNAANAQIAAGNNSAAMNAGLIQGIGQLGAGAMNAYATYKKG